MKVQSSIIENKYLRVKSINIGACLYEVYDKRKKINLILNLGSKENYRNKNFYVGATCGRYAGRISNSRFKIKNKIYKLDGNEGRNTLPMRVGLMNARAIAYVFILASMITLGLAHLYGPFEYHQIVFHAPAIFILFSLNGPLF